MIGRDRRAATSKSNQNQTAGNDSTQIQLTSGTINVVTGVTRQEAKEIAQEVSKAAIAEYSEQAHAQAMARVSSFDNRLVDGLSERGQLDQFAVPAFQKILRKAQVAAAATERDSDLDVLVKLLEQRTETDMSRIQLANISRAVEITDEVDDQALVAMTTYYTLMNPPIGTGTLASNLDKVEAQLARVITSGLPLGNEWVEHLAVLGAMRSSSGLFGMKSLEAVWAESSFSGFVAMGSPTSSLARLDGARLADSGPLLPLIEHELKDGFHRLDLPSKRSLDIILARMVESGLAVDPGEYRRAATEEFGLGVVDNDAQNAFVTEIEQRPTIQIARDWWNQYVGGKYSFQANGVGWFLAIANSRRITPPGA